MRRYMVAWMWSLIIIMMRFILQYFYSEQFWVPLQILEIFRKWNLILLIIMRCLFITHMQFSQLQAIDVYFVKSSFFVFVFFSLTEIQESYTSQSNFVPRLFTRFRLITWSSKLLCIGGGVVQTSSTYLTYLCLRN